MLPGNRQAYNAQNRVLPPIAELHKEMEDIKKQLGMIQNLLSNKSDS